jgi:hypothetical protein
VPDVGGEESHHGGIDPPEVVREEQHLTSCSQVLSKSS